MKTLTSTLEIVLEIVNEILGEWRGVNILDCPSWAVSLKKLRSDIERFITAVETPPDRLDAICKRAEEHGLLDEINLFIDDMIESVEVGFAKSLEQHKARHELVANPDCFRTRDDFEKIKTIITKWPSEHASGAKRANIKFCEWMGDDWFFGYGKDETCCFEGTWWDMICFARNILAHPNTKSAAPEYYKPELANDNYTGEEMPYEFAEKEEQNDGG